MGFLKSFFENVFHEQGQLQRATPFEHLSEADLEAHLDVKQYGNFQLTDAIRPSFSLEVVPQEGFRHDLYRDEESNTSVPVLMAAASGPHLFDTFLDLLDPLGHIVDVVLETSHGRECHGHADLYREQIDMPVLKSILCDFEDLLTNDGCTGIAVLNPGAQQEVQFDEHKLLIVYGNDLSEHEDVLLDRGIPHSDDIRFITEAEHVHSTNDRYLRQFEELKYRLGLETGY